MFCVISNFDTLTVDRVASPLNLLQVTMWYTCYPRHVSDSQSEFSPESLVPWEGCHWFIGRAPREGYWFTGSAHVFQVVHLGELLSLLVSYFVSNIFLICGKKMSTYKLTHRMSFGLFFHQKNVESIEKYKLESNMHSSSS